MPRPTSIQIDQEALIHNVARMRQLTPHQRMVAMVKANAYGCGITHVIPALEGQVDAYGVALLEEAFAIRQLGAKTPCVVFQGVFEPREWGWAASEGFEVIIHEQRQLTWLLETPLSQPIQVWVKVDTGMHRLGFSPEKVHEVLNVLEACSWVKKPLIVMTHFASADVIEAPHNTAQWTVFESLNLPAGTCKSLANSAAIFKFPHTHADIVRPGIALYGASPFSDKIGKDLGLQPVMTFSSQIEAIQSIKTGESVGYGGVWSAQRPSKIGIVAAGYGDGYPRHIQPDTPVAVHGQYLPIVGRVSMDTLAVDLTPLPKAQLGDAVELWGKTVPIEWIAKSADTIAYELLCKTLSRPSMQHNVSS